MHFEVHSFSLIALVEKQPTIPFSNYKKVARYVMCCMAKHDNALHDFVDGDTLK